MTDATIQPGPAAAVLTGVDPPAAPPPSAPVAPPGQPSAPDWTKGWDAADVGTVEKRGWRTPQDLYKSYSELQKTLSHDKIVLPKDGADVKEWDAVFNRLGRPEAADKYTMPKGSDEAFFKAVVPDLHAAGLTQKQVDAAAAAINKYGESTLAVQRDQAMRDQEAGMAELNREWGPSAAKEIELARRAMRGVGLSVQDVDSAIMAMGAGGTQKLMKALTMAGRAIAEDNSGDIRSDDVLGFGNTPNRAAAELQELKGDKAFMDRVRARDPAAKAKYDRLLQSLGEDRARRTVGKAY